MGEGKAIYQLPLSVVPQKIQTITAVDRDEPSGGHHFFFTLAAESSVKANFSVRDNGGEFPSLFSLCQEVEGNRKPLRSWAFWRFGPAHSALLHSAVSVPERLSLFPIDNTAGIYTRRTGFRRAQQSTHLVAVVISDGAVPMMSSTGTLTVRVCTCDRDGNMEMCNTEALSGTAGLSTGALVAILLCVLILLRKCQKKAVTN